MTNYKEMSSDKGILGRLNRELEGVVRHEGDETYQQGLNEINDQGHKRVRIKKLGLSYSVSSRYFSG